MPPELVTSDNLAASVWADTAYRLAANEAWLAELGRVSRIHRKKPPGRAAPESAPEPPSGGQCPRSGMPAGLSDRHPIRFPQAPRPIRAHHGAGAAIA